MERNLHLRFPNVYHQEDQVSNALRAYYGHHLVPVPDNTHFLSNDLIPEPINAAFPAMFQVKGKKSIVEDPTLSTIGLAHCAHPTVVACSICACFLRVDSVVQDEDDDSTPILVTPDGNVNIFELPSVDEHCHSSLHLDRCRVFEPLAIDHLRGFLASFVLEFIPNEELQKVCAVDIEVFVAEILAFSVAELALRIQHCSVAWDLPSILWQELTGSLTRQQQQYQLYFPQCSNGPLNETAKVSRLGELPAAKRQKLLENLHCPRDAFHLNKWKKFEYDFLVAVVTSLLSHVRDEKSATSFSGDIAGVDSQVKAFQTALERGELLVNRPDLIPNDISLAAKAAVKIVYSTDFHPLFDENRHSFLRPLSSCSREWMENFGAPVLTHPMPLPQYEGLLLPLEFLYLCEAWQGSTPPVKCPQNVHPIPKQVYFTPRCERPIDDLNFVILNGNGSTRTKSGGEVHLQNNTPRERFVLGCARPPVLRGFENTPSPRLHTLSSRTVMTPENIVRGILGSGAYGCDGRLGHQFVAEGVHRWLLEPRDRHINQRSGFTLLSERGDPIEFVVHEWLFSDLKKDRAQEGEDTIVPGEEVTSTIINRLTPDRIAAGLVHVCLPLRWNGRLEEPGPARRSTGFPPPFPPVRGAGLWQHNNLLMPEWLENDVVLKLQQRRQIIESQVVQLQKALEHRQSGKRRRRLVPVVKEDGSDDEELSEEDDENDEEIEEEEEEEDAESAEQEEEDAEDEEVEQDCDRQELLDLVLLFLKNDNGGQGVTCREIKSHSYVIVQDPLGNKKSPKFFVFQISEAFPAVPTGFNEKVRLWPADVPLPFETPRDISIEEMLQPIDFPQEVPANCTIRTELCWDPAVFPTDAIYALSHAGYAGRDKNIAALLRRYRTPLSKETTQAELTQWYWLDEMRTLMSLALGVKKKKTMGKDLIRQLRAHLTKNGDEVQPKN